MNTMVEQIKHLKLVHPNCPICNKRLKIPISCHIVENSPSFPVGFSFKHCNQNLIIYLDANYSVRGVETSHIIEIQEDSEGSKPFMLTIDVDDHKSVEERTFFFCNAGCEEAQKVAIPNLVEKQLLRVIHNTKGICLENLREKVLKLEKALNISITYDMIKNLLNKYVENGIISLEVIDIDSVVGN